MDLSIQLEKKVLGFPHKIQARFHVHSIEINRYEETNDSMGMLIRHLIVDILVYIHFSSILLQNCVIKCHLRIGNIIISDGYLSKVTLFYINKKTDYQCIFGWDWEV